MKEGAPELWIGGRTHTRKKRECVGHSLTTSLHWGTILPFTVAARFSPQSAADLGPVSPNTQLRKKAPMKRAYLVCLVQLLTLFLFSQSNSVSVINPSAKVAPPISASQSDPKAQARILDQYGKLPLSFEANHGQTDERVKFLSRTSAYSLFLTADEAVLTLRGKKAKNPAPRGASHFAEHTASLKRCADANQSSFTGAKPCPCRKPCRS